MDSFEPLFEGLRRSMAGIEQANAGMAIALSEMRAVIDAALQAKSEHEDVRETVSRLEATILDLIQQVQNLRRDLGRNGQ